MPGIAIIGAIVAFAAALVGAMLLQRDAGRRASGQVPTPKAARRNRIVFIVLMTIGVGTVLALRAMQIVRLFP